MAISFVQKSETTGIAVLIPGIMGSQLTRNGAVLWGENLVENYQLLMGNPGALVWTGEAAEAELLRHIRVGWKMFPLKKADLRLAERSSPVGRAGGGSLGIEAVGTAGRASAVTEAVDDHCSQHGRVTDAGGRGYGTDPSRMAGQDRIYWNAARGRASVIPNDLRPSRITVLQ